MSVLVVDASVAVKWFIAEDLAPAALAVLREEHDLHAPDFFLLEMDNICCKWIRRGIITTGEGSRIRRSIRQWPISLHRFLTFLDSAFAIASQSPCSVYDCLHVALAALLECRMVTADRRLYDGLADGPFARHVLWIEDLADNP